MGQFPLTLSRFIIRSQAEHPEATGEFSSLLSQIGLVGKVIAHDLRRAGLINSKFDKSFLDNLTKLRLPTFRNADVDAGTRYLGRILLHCGVPTKCLGDYYRVVTEQRSKDPGIDAETFVSWAAGRAEMDRLYNVDMPVNRFLRFGGKQ